MSSLTPPARRSGFSISERLLLLADEVIACWYHCCTAYRSKWHEADMLVASVDVRFSG
jgi:hypothetical protein